MTNKVLGGGALDGNLGLNPTFADFDIPLGRVVQSIDDNGTVFYWLVETTSKGGWLLANGLYANPTKVVGDSLPVIAGSFVDGFTFTAPNQVGIDSNGDEWKYIGDDSLPVAVAPNTDPSASGDFKRLGKPSKDDYLNLKIFQSPTDGGLTEIQTKTANGGEVYEVRKTSDDSLATIYSDAAGTIEIAQNGTSNVSNSDGVVEFYIDDGDYYVEVGGVKGGLLVSTLKPFLTVADMASAKYLSKYAEGARVEWQGYYEQSDGGSNWGVLKFGAHTADGGSIFSIDSNTYIEANLKGKSINAGKFGFTGGDSDRTQNLQAALDFFSNSNEFGKFKIPPLKHKVSSVSSSFKEKTIDMRGAEIVAISENSFLWSHRGASCVWLGGKVEPENYGESSRYMGFYIYNDSSMSNSSFNTFKDMFIYGMWKGVSIHMNESIGGNYRHVFSNVRIDGVSKDIPDSYCVSLTNEGTNGDSAGNDTKFTNGCLLRKCENGIILVNSLGFKYIGSSIDGCVNGIKYDSGSHLNIITSYLEYNDVGLNLVNQPYKYSIIGGSFSNTVQIDGDLLNDVRGSISGCANLTDTGQYIENVSGVVNLGSNGGAVVGESDGSLNNVQGVEVTRTSQDLTQIRSTSSLVGITLNDNGDMSLASRRNLFGQVGFTIHESLQSISTFPNTSYIYSDTSTGEYSIIIHVGGLFRAKIPLDSFV